MIEQEIKYKNARIRISKPERTKEEEREFLREATEKFLKAVAIQKGIFNGKSN